jgi:hypothetical protein
LEVNGEGRGFEKMFGSFLKNAEQINGIVMGIGKGRGGRGGGGGHLPTVLTAPTIPLNHPFFFGVSVAEPAATASCPAKMKRHQHCKYGNALAPHRRCCHAPPPARLSEFRPPPERSGGLLKHVNDLRQQTLELEGCSKCGMGAGAVNTSP